MRDARGIIFDKDGTLFLFQETWGGTIGRALDLLAGGDAARLRAAAAALDFDPGARRFAPTSVVIAGTSAEVAAALRPVFPEQEDIIAVLDAVGTDAEQVPVPGLRETLAALASDHPLGVVTNDSAAPARAHLESVGILGHFGFVAGYDSGHGAKPAPGPLLACATAFGLAPERCVMVGDSRHDLVAGRAAGMTTVGVLTGVAEADALSDLADVILPDIRGLPAWLRAGAS